MEKKLVFYIMQTMITHLLTRNIIRLSYLQQPEILKKYLNYM